MSRFRDRAAVLPDHVRMSDWCWKYRAEVWWCGDEECDCTQPQITLMTPNLEAGRPWYRLTSLWEGTFRTGGDTAGQQEELEAECARRGIPVGISPVPQTAKP